MTVNPPAVRQSGAIVCDADDQPPIGLTHRHLNVALAQQDARPMANRILHERLEDEARNKSGVRIVLSANVNCDAVFEAETLDHEVVLKECEFVLDSNFLPSGMIERGA